jgi:hypothetical protein
LKNFPWLEGAPEQLFAGRRLRRRSNDLAMLRRTAAKGNPNIIDANSRAINSADFVTIS